MAAYRRVYDSRHLQADCQEPGSAPEPYARYLSMDYFYLFLHILASLDSWQQLTTTDYQTLSKESQFHYEIYNFYVATSLMGTLSWTIKNLMPNSHRPPDETRRSCLCRIRWCELSRPDKCVLRRSASSGRTAPPDTLRHRTHLSGGRADLVHTATPDTTKQSCLRRVWRGGLS